MNRILATLFLAACAYAQSPLATRLTCLSDRECVELAKIAYFETSLGQDGSLVAGLIVAGGYPQGLTPEAATELVKLIGADKLPQLTAFSTGEWYDISKITSFRLPIATVYTDRYGQVIIVDGWTADPSVVAENFLRGLMGLPTKMYAEPSSTEPSKGPICGTWVESDGFRIVPCPQDEGPTPAPKNDGAIRL